MDYKKYRIFSETTSPERSGPLIL